MVPHLERPSPRPTPAPDAQNESRPPQADAARWRQLFAGASAREILGRIVQGDPLGLRTHVARTLEREAWLLDADRVLLRSFARTARAALRYHGHPELEAWLGSIVVESATELLDDEREAERNGTSVPPTPGSAFADLARPLKLEPQRLGRACARFNRLNAPERRAFFELVLRGRSLDLLARESGESATEIARRARRALEVFLSKEGRAAAPEETT